MSKTASEKRFKTLFITGWYPTRQNPISGIFVREHAKAVQLYDDVIVLHLAGADPTLKKPCLLVQETDPRLTENIPTYHTYFKSSPIPHTSFLHYYWGIFQAYRELAATGFKPDVIHAHVYYAGFAAVLLGKLTGLPVVITEHSSVFPRKLLTRFAIWQARIAFRYAAAVLPVSKSLQKAIEDYRIKAHFEIMPNVVDTNIFFPPDRFKENKIKQLLFVGGLHPVKGIPYLLNALAELQKERQDWHLNIVGDGPSRLEYEQQVANLGLGEYVTFHGAKSKMAVAEFMRNADLFVLPSLFETFSVVSIEALASGLPVLATYPGGTEEFIEDKTGKLVKSKSIVALTEGLSFILKNRHLYSTQYISTYATNRFSPMFVGAQIHLIYRSVTQSN